MCDALPSQTGNQAKHLNVGASNVRETNSRIVRPLETRPMKSPTNGDQIAALRSGAVATNVKPPRGLTRRRGRRGGQRLPDQACFWSKNCSSSVEPLSAAVEDVASIVVVTASK